MEQSEIENKRYLKWFNKIYIWFDGFTDDLLFYVAISTLFYTIVKGFSAQEIVFLTTISSLISIILRVPLIKLIQLIGSTKSVRIGIGLLVIASILITFGTSYITIMIAECIYSIAFVFRGMLSVVLRHNLIYQKLEDDYIKVKNKASILYAIITAIVAFIAGFLFNINNYLPMYLCIFFCLICFIISFSIKEVSNGNKDNKEENNKIKSRVSKIIWVAFISYGLFYGLIAMGQGNGKLLIQYELLNTYNIEQTAIYLSIIVAISRVARIISNLYFNKLYNIYKDKISIILGTMLIGAYMFLAIGFFINFNILLKFSIMAIGFFLILMARDPFRIYMQDVSLKVTQPEQHKLVIAYLEFSRNIGTTILSLGISALLIKIDMIYIIILLGILAILELFVILKLYRLLKKV